MKEQKTQQVYIISDEQKMIRKHITTNMSMIIYRPMSKTQSIELHMFTSTSFGFTQQQKIHTAG